MQCGYVFVMDTHTGIPDGETKSLYFPADHDVFTQLSSMGKSDIDTEVVRSAITYHFSEGVDPYLHVNYWSDVEPLLTEDILERSLIELLDRDKDGWAFSYCLFDFGAEVSSNHILRSMNIRLKPALRFDDQLFKLKPLRV